MRHSCSSCVSGLVITSISPLSTSCFSVKRPPWPLTTTVSHVSRNFFPLCARPCACTRILRKTRELRRGEVAVISLMRHVGTPPPQRQLPQRPGVPDTQPGGGRHCPNFNLSESAYSVRAISGKRVREILQAIQLALMPLGSGPCGIQIQTSHSGVKLEIKLQAELHDSVRFANGDHRCRGRQRS